MDKGVTFYFDVKQITKKKIDGKLDETLIISLYHERNEKGARSDGISSFGG